MAADQVLPLPTERLRHVAYAGGWKKFEWLWDRVISARQVNRALPLLETLLSGFGEHAADDNSIRRLGEPARGLRALPALPLPVPPGVRVARRAVGEKEPYAS